MLASLKRLDSKRSVELIRHANNDSVYIRARNKLLGRGHNGSNAVLLRSLLRQRQINIGNGRNLALVSQLGKFFRMHAADVARPDQSDPDFIYSRQ
ncbi:hypothetical protein D3C78_1594650 [compost metagenome]